MIEPPSPQPGAANAVPDSRARYRGALLGLAAGDALGTTLEFEPPGTFTPITDMVGGGPFGLEAGEWTDDTAMALCLAASLVECEGFDLVDQMERYVRWYRNGYMSATGSCFDIGHTVAAALARFESRGNPFAGDRAPRFGGNGSLMRLAPVPLAFAHDPYEAIRLAAVMSRTTHSAAEPVSACRYLAGLMVGALRGVPKERLLAARYSPMPELWDHHPLAPRVDAVAAGSFKTRRPPDIRGTGYVVQTLEAALWAFWTTDDFASGALAAVNLGEDADTTGAVYGQLAGAWYGIDGIPRPWIDRIAMKEQILDLADGLLALATAPALSEVP
ncbi:MAG: ADP-ribosylglycohydrolase family protein [Gammaproteobacteria bacterium]|nr:ADP-ribosylglycohydrolase family protein [Gammaproteobacteria bacterium]